MCVISMCRPNIMYMLNTSRSYIVRMLNAQENSVRFIKCTRECGALINCADLHVARLLNARQTSRQTSSEVAFVYKALHCLQGLERVMQVLMVRNFLYCHLSRRQHSPEES